MKSKNSFYPYLKKWFNQHRHFVLVLLFFLPLLVLFFNMAGDSGRMFVLFSDEATLELRVQNAAYGVQYLGPYSRFGWNHPGPLYFYLLLPFYIFSGLGTVSLYLGALFINIFAVVTILYYIYKSGNRGFFYAAGFFLALYLYFFLGFTVLRSIWNPMVTILPFGSLVFMSVHLGMGNIKTLPVMAFFASFVVQTHISYGPVLVLVVMNALVLYILEKRHENVTLRKFFSLEVWRALVFTGVVLLVLWILPIFEQLSNPPGNLYKIAYHFASSEAVAGHSLAQSLSAVSAAVNAPLAAIPGAGHRFFLLFHIVLLAAAMVYNFKTRNKYFAYLLLLGLGCLMVAVASVTRITGDIFPYLIKWMSVIGFINWLVIGFTGGSLLWARLERRWGKSLGQPRGKQLLKVVPYALVIIAAVGFLAATLAPVSAAAKVERDLPEARIVKKITDGIKTYIRRTGLPHFTLVLRRDMWPIEAGVVNQLYKSSVPFSLEEDWLFWFGYQFREEGVRDDGGQAERGQARNIKDILVFKRGAAPGEDTENRSLVYRLGQISIIHIKRERTYNDNRH